MASNAAATRIKASFISLNGLMFLLMLWLCYKAWQVLSFGDAITFTLLMIALITIGAFQTWKRNKLYNKVFEQFKSSVYNCLNSPGQPCRDIDISGPKEVRQLANQYNNMIYQLTDNVSKYYTTAVQLSAHCQRVKINTESIIQQIDTQFQQTIQTYDAIREIQPILKHIRETAHTTASQAIQHEHDGDTGKVMISEAMGGIMSLVEEVKLIDNMVSNVGNETKSINNIMNMINGVAEKTNLLALNAAIEAARAGEHGRGFSIVADEVRELASQTKSYTKQIKDMIDTLTNSVDMASKTTFNCMKIATHSDELIENIVIAYSEVVGSLHTFSSLSSELDNTFSTEEEVLKKLNTGSLNIDQIATVTNQCIENINEYTEELLQLNMEIKRSFDSHYDEVDINQSPDLHHN